MPDKDDDVPSNRTETAANERLAVVENEIKHVKEGVSVIRSVQHDIRGEMQKFVFEEARCVAALERIADQTKHLPELATKLKTFEEMRPELENVIKESVRRGGGWRAAGLIATVTMGAITMFGAVAGGIIWLAGIGKVAAVH